MPLDDRGRSCFLDIINCIRDIRAFTDGVSYHVFAMEKMRKLAVERQLEHELEQIQELRDLFQQK